jgi:hypothetical protein
MTFAMARIRHYKQTGALFDSDKALILHLLSKTGSCDKVGNILYCSQVTIHSLARSYGVKFNRKNNRTGKGNFLEKLNTLRESYTDDQISNMTSWQISKIIKHPYNSTISSLKWHGVNYKKMIGKNRNGRS